MISRNRQERINELLLLHESLIIHCLQNIVDTANKTWVIHLHAGPSINQTLIYILAIESLNRPNYGQCLLKMAALWAIAHGMAMSFSLMQLFHPNCETKRNWNSRKHNKGLRGPWHDKLSLWYGIVRALPHLPRHKLQHIWDELFDFLKCVFIKGFRSSSQIIQGLDPRVSVR